MALLAGPMAPPVAAAGATITVDATCSLADAIRSANTDTSVSTCEAGTGADTIELSGNVVVTSTVGYYYNRDAALPLVTGELTIDGNGFTIAPDVTPANYRLMAIARNSDVVLKDVTVSGFGQGYNGTGGAIHARAASLTVEDATFTGNRGGQGGAIAVYGLPTSCCGPIEQYGYLTINNSTMDNNISSQGGVINTNRTRVTIDGSSFSGNYAQSRGGVMVQQRGHITITNSIFSDNSTNGEGGAMQFKYAGNRVISNTVISGNTSINRGGGMDIDFGGDGTFLIQNSLIHSNTTYNPNNRGYARGGGLTNRADLTIINTTISNNKADRVGGGLTFDNRRVTLINSTITGNEAPKGGAIGGRAYAGYFTIINSTLTDNTATDKGGAIYTTSGTVNSNFISNTIVSGNSAPLGAEIYRPSNKSAIISNGGNVFGHSGLSATAAFGNFTPGINDFDATTGNENRATSTPTALSAILNTTAADNGSPSTLPGGHVMLTHNLVVGSPAIDFISSSPCDPATDQRGLARPIGDGCDAGAIEFQPPRDVFVSTFTAGTVDSLSYGPHDILRWDANDESWSKWFDGTAAGLQPTSKFKHNINSIWISDTESADFAVSFIQNQQRIGTLGWVDGYDILWWDGSAFSRWFEGEKVGLNVKTQEKIDGLHVLPQAPAGSAFSGANCQAYLLVSTMGPGRVDTGLPGPSNKLKFRGEDILGFCATNLGVNTTGLWEMVLDGSTMLPKLPANSVDSISVSADGTQVYATVRRQLPLNSQVFVYDIAAKTVSGPILSFADAGLTSATDALQVVGELGEN